MSTTGKIAVTEGTGAKNVASYSIAEDAITKELQRVVLSDSSGTEIASSATLIGAVTETAPTTDTASSGLNGRLQRIAQRITTLIATTFGITGDVAAGSSDSGNPVKIGAIAKSSEPTAVTTGQRANMYTDLVGKQVVLPYANPENFVSGLTAAMTGTTSTSLIAAPASGLRNYITHIIATNSHATVGTFVIIQDGSGGTTLYEGYAAAAGGGFSISFPTPLRQPTTATALYCADVTTGANVIVSASGYKGA